MSLNDPNNWNVTDPFPQKHLGEIRSYADRALAFYARNKNKIGNGGHIEIFGAIIMLQGLEYHYNNFLEIDSNIERYDRTKIDHDTVLRIKLDPERSKNLIILSHEAIAYLNRVGQFKVFYESDFSKDAIKGIKRSTIDKSAMLRHSYSAHRNIDQHPDNKDQNYYLAMNFESGCLFDQKGSRIFQVKCQNGEFWDFNIIQSHNEIMKEAFDIIKAVIDSKIVLTRSN